MDIYIMIRTEQDPAPRNHIDAAHENLLFCIIYFSTATFSLCCDNIESMLDAARLRNAALGITGVLGYYDGSFFQVLEGLEDAVTSLFAKISSDPKHHSIIPIFQSSIDQRSFADWSMALVTPQTVGPERRAFCVDLGALKPHLRSSHQNAITLTINIFNEWIK